MKKKLKRLLFPSGCTNFFKTQKSCLGHNLVTRVEEWFVPTTEMSLIWAFLYDQIWQHDLNVLLVEEREYNILTA